MDYWTFYCHEKLMLERVKGTQTNEQLLIVDQISSPKINTLCKLSKYMENYTFLSSSGLRFLVMGLDCWLMFSVRRSTRRTNLFIRILEHDVRKRHQQTKEQGRERERGAAGICNTKGVFSSCYEAFLIQDLLESKPNRWLRFKLLLSTCFGGAVRRCCGSRNYDSRAPVSYTTSFRPNLWISS